MDREQYVSPFSRRYASERMQYLFSEEKKFRTWKRLWIALAESEKELGLDISDAQLAELRAFADVIDYETAEAKEREIRHDVMSHVHAYAMQAPEGGKILHLGATSCFVGDNTDLIILREALDEILVKLRRVIANLAAFAEAQKKLPTLGFTHYQPAQLTTVGKRACLWLQDFVTDFEELLYRRNGLKARGVKGTTGTQASFMNLFDNDSSRVRELDRLLSEKIGFPASYPVTGQTYPRKTDYLILSALSSLGQSSHRFATDLRLLSNLRELEEPFGKKQVGSSAMAYKRNPMRSERICSLARFLIALSENPAYTASVQWLERTLDDSANRRLSLAEAFLSADAILILLENVTDGLIVNEAMIDKHVAQELPFMATENLLMEGSKLGHSRQELHEVIREHSHAAAAELKKGGDNPLLDLLAADGRFPLNREAIDRVLAAGNFTGRASEQVDEFLTGFVRPLLDAHPEREQDREADGIL